MEIQKRPLVGTYTTATRAIAAHNVRVSLSANSRMTGDPK